MFSLPPCSDRRPRAAMLPETTTNVRGRSEQQETMNTNDLRPISVVFIPALLCDEAMYRNVIETLGEIIEAHVLLSPKGSLEDSAADLVVHPEASEAAAAFKAMAGRIGSVVGATRALPRSPGLRLSANAEEARRVRGAHRQFSSRPFFFAANFDGMRRTIYE